MSRHFILSAAAIVLFNCGSAVLAQPLEVPPPASAEELDLESGADMELTLHSTYTASADFTDLPGEVSVWRNGADFELRLPFGDRAQLSLGAGVEHASYDFKGATGLLPTGGGGGTLRGPTPGDPFDSVLTYSLDAVLMARASERWSWLVGGGVQSSGESGANFSDTLSYTLSGGMIYHMSEKLSLGVLLYGGVDIDEDLFLFPIPIIEWQMSDKWSFSIQGADALLRYEADEHWAYGAAIGFDGGSFRLDGDGPTPNAIIQEQRLPLAGFVEWTPGPGLTLRGSVGVDLRHHYEALDATGARISEDTTEPALEVGLALVIRF